MKFLGRLYLRILGAIIGALIGGLVLAIFFAAIYFFLEILDFSTIRARVPVVLIFAPIVGAIFGFMAGYPLLDKNRKYEHTYEMSPKKREETSERLQKVLEFVSSKDITANILDRYSEITSSFDSRYTENVIAKVFNNEISKKDFKRLLREIETKLDVWYKEERSLDFIALFMLITAIESTNDLKKKPNAYMVWRPVINGLEKAEHFQRNMIPPHLVNGLT